MSAYTRREFVKTSAAVTAAAAMAPLASGRGFFAGGSDTIRVGVIGCGGRGTGAAFNAIEAAPNTTIVALADVMPDRVESCRGELVKLGDRVQVSDDRCFTGFDAYERLIRDGGVDCVILATPPHFRPAHLAAAVVAGKHVFMEKPVAVDPAGVRSVLASAMLAERKGLSIVAGTQRRHEACYIEAMARINGGSLGRVVHASCYWNQGGLWVHDRKPEWTDMEWQLRNWLYFTWLSGDHIVEQHVHNLDVVNWAIGETPARCTALGGRQARTDSKYGHIYDHFAVEFEYPSGATVLSMCRQIDGTPPRVEERIVGTEGKAVTRPGFAVIEGASAWRFRGENPGPYVQEHVSLVASIVNGAGRNEAKTVAESTLTAIMGRMAAYTGQEVTWEQALNSKLDLTPPSYEFGPLPTPEVAIPGRTPLV